MIEAIEESFDRAGYETRTGYDMRSARRSINLMFAEWANQGINMWTVDERSQALTSGTASYTLETDIVDLIEYMVNVLNTSPVQRLNVTRVSVSTFASRTNPELTGRPTEIYIDRQRDAPVVKLWPVPDSSSYILYYWVLRRIEDAGDYTNTADLPFRFLPAFVSGLAAKLSEKKQPNDANLIGRLQQQAARDWAAAASEDRERATLMITPVNSYRI